MARLCPVCHQWLTHNGPVKTKAGWAERMKDDTIDLALLYTQFTMKHFYTGAGLKCEHPSSVLLKELCPHFTTLPGVQPLPTHETVGMCFPMPGTMVMDHVSYLLFTFVLFFWVYVLTLNFDLIVLMFLVWKIKASSSTEKY